MLSAKMGWIAASALVVGGLGSVAILGLGATRTTASAPVAAQNSAARSVIDAALKQPSGCAAGAGLVQGGGSAVSSTLFSRMAGFAQQAHVTGGLGRQVFVVDQLGDAAGNPPAGTLRDAVKRAEAAGGGWITFADSLGNSPRIDLAKVLPLPSNVTIDGGCSNVTITTDSPYSILKISGPASNIVIARLNLEQRSAPTAREGGDCISVMRGADRIWIAYNSLRQCSDGLIDVTQSPIGDTPTRVTIAYNRFFDHVEDMLIGSNDCAKGRTAAWCSQSEPWRWDRGVQVTLQRNLFDSTAQRHPRISGLAYVHMVDNAIVFTPGHKFDGREVNAYGSFVGAGSRLYADNNLYLAQGTFQKPARAIEAIAGDEPSSRGEQGTAAIRLHGNRVVGAEAPSELNAANIPEPPYTLAPALGLGSDWHAAMACIAARTGPRGFARMGCKG